MRMGQHLLLSTIFALVVCVAHSLAQSHGGPLYKACSATDKTNCTHDLGHSNRDECTGWCTAGPALFTPTHLDVCENETATMSTRLTDGVVDLKGNLVVKDAQGRPDEGLQIDWDDGASTNYDLKNGTNYYPTHSWVQATTYVPSLLYHDQLKYDNGSSSCSYECRLQAQINVTVHLSTAPECVGGHYHLVPKTDTKKKESK